MKQPIKWRDGEMTPELVESWREQTTRAWERMSHLLGWHVGEGGAHPLLSREMVSKVIARLSELAEYELELREAIRGAFRTGAADEEGL